MRRILFILSIFTFLFIFLPKPSQAFNCINDVRCAECDRCGYCNNQAVPKAPGNWEQCRACLYPDASPDFKENESLVIGQNPDTTLFEQVTPAVGKYYTQLGCIDTGVDSFSDPSAPGGVLNFMLTKVIFPTVGVLAFMSLIYGAFLLITAESRPDQIARGKSYIVGAIVGLIFTLSIILIVNTLAGDILRIPGFSSSKIRINASGVRNGTERDLIKDPEMIILLNDEEIDRFVVPGINGSPSTADYKIYGVTSATFDPKKDSISIYYPNDYCQRMYNCGGSGYSANRDLFINYLEIDGKKCLKFTNSGDNTDRSPSAYLWWNGTATCTQWES